MRLFLIFLFAFSAFAIKGEYTDSENPENVCMINFIVPCEDDPQKTCKGACSASYLGGDKLITANHCLQSLYVASSKSVTCPNGETREIVNPLINPRGAGFDYDQDIGLISVNGKFSVEEMSVVSGEAEFDELISHPENCFLAGYGMDNEEKWGKLKVALTKQVETELVMSLHSLSLEPEKISLRGNYADHGDSGGPYYCKKNGKNILMAVLQGGTEGIEYTLAEKLLQSGDWVRFHLSELSDGTNDLYRKYDYALDFCHAVANCLVDLKEASELGKDIGAIVLEVESKLRSKTLVPTIEGRSDRTLLEKELDDMIEEWRHLHSLCYDNK